MTKRWFAGLLMVLIIAISWSTCSAAKKRQTQPKWTKKQQQILIGCEKTLTTLLQRAKKQLASYDNSYCCSITTKHSDWEHARAKERIYKIVAGLTNRSFFIDDILFTDERKDCKVFLACRLNRYAKAGLKNDKLNKKRFGIDYRVSFLPKQQRVDIEFILPNDNYGPCFVFDYQGKLKNIQLLFCE